MVEYHTDFISKLYDILKLYLSEEESKKYSNEIANECINWTISEAKSKSILNKWSDKQFCLIYANKCYNILQHLDTSSRVNDSTLIKAIQNNISAYEIINKPLYELAPAASQKIRDKVQLQSTIVNKVKITTLHTCPVKTCKANNARFEQKQVRAADEGSTMFLCCLSCGHNWRVNN
jgi:DNA-directed RNA polymerase subunit M/transcription elongation factor TFIIS